MASTNSRKKKKPVGKLLLFGVGSAILYSLVFTYQGLITAYFTRGALYATLPILSAFAFSYVHGHFTGYFWTVLGIEAKQSAVVKPRMDVERPEKRERLQPQPRLRA